MSRCCAGPAVALDLTHETQGQEFHVLVERDEDGWLVASVPQLPGCYTQAKSYDVLMKRIREATEA